MRFVLCTFLIYGFLAIACDGSEPPEPTPATTSPPIEATAPAQTPTGGVFRNVPAHWLAEEPPFFQGQEPPRPYQERAPPGVAAEWSLYLVEGAAAPPQRLYSTGRWLCCELWWADDSRNLIVPFWTAATDGTQYMRGAKFGSAGPGFESGAEFVLDQGAVLWPSPDGQLLLSTYGPRIRIYLRGQDASWRRLAEPDVRLGLVDLSPDGQKLLLTSPRSPPGSPESGSTYVVPLSDGTAVELERRIVGGAGSWHPGSSSFAAILDGEVHLIEPFTRGLRRLTNGFGADYASFHWSPDGRLLVAGGDVIDTATGQRTRLLDARRVVGSILSPDGRYFLASEDPLAPDPSAQESGPSRVCETEDTLANRTFLLDRATSESRVLLDCEDGFFIVAPSVSPSVGTRTWFADGRHVIVYTYSCWSCEGSLTRISLLDVETGALRTLGEGRSLAAAAISPLGDQVLIGGETLRLFSASGALLREIPLPPGTEVTRISWSPDGQKFVYTVGPLGVRPGI